MRFCQTDGTPLVDEVEAAPPVDPYATIVSAPITPIQAPPEEDPFKTVVAAPQEGSAPEGSGDLLQIPEADPLKTMFVSEEEIRKEMLSSEPKEDPIFEVPAEPVPEPPVFNEPSLSPPSFGDMAPPASPFSASSDPEPASYSDPEPEPESNEDATLISPAPIPSPFSDPAPQSYEVPPAIPEYKEPEPAPNPFDQPSFSPAAETFDPPPAQMEWAPPPAPDASWQNQPVGQDTPFKPPAASQGLDQTLPIVSLVLGLLSLCCYISPVTGLAALITGFLGMKNAKNDPSKYGGRGLAIAGMITGGLMFFVGVGYYVFVILVYAGILGSSMLGGF